MTIIEFKRKYKLRQIIGSSEDEWINIKVGVIVSPCPVGFVIYRCCAGRMKKDSDGERAIRLRSRYKIVKTLSEAVKVLDKIFNK